MGSGYIKGAIGRRPHKLTKSFISLFSTAGSIRACIMGGYLSRWLASRCIRVYGRYHYPFWWITMSSEPISGIYSGVLYFYLTGQRGITKPTRFLDYEIIGVWHFWVAREQLSHDELESVPHSTVRAFCGPKNTSTSANLLYCVKYT